MDIIGSILRWCIAACLIYGCIGGMINYYKIIFYRASRRHRRRNNVYQISDYQTHNYFEPK